MEIGNSPTPNTHSMLNCPGWNKRLSTSFSGSSVRVNVSGVSLATSRTAYGCGSIGSVVIAVAMIITGLRIRRATASGSPPAAAP